jgi:hypothetical protein
MKNKLFEKFSPFAISQTVYLETKRTTDIEELTDVELEKIYRLFFPQQPTLAEQVFNGKHNDLKKKHKSNILTVATRIGLKDADDWEKFNNWMLKIGRYKKALKDHNLQELQGLERQLRAAESNYKASAEKAGNKAWYHKNKFSIPSKN